MKPSHGVLGLALLAALGCSSTPKSTSERVEADNRAEYLKMVDRRLDNLEEQASKMSEPRASRLRADIESARARVKVMEDAPSDQWEEFRDPIDERLSRIQQMTDSTPAE